MKQRILALLCSFSIMFSLLPATAYATQADFSPEEADSIEITDVLEENIIADSDNFSADSEVITTDSDDVSADSNIITTDSDVITTDSDDISADYTEETDLTQNDDHGYEVPPVTNAQVKDFPGFEYALFSCDYVDQAAEMAVNFQIFHDGSFVTWDYINTFDISSTNCKIKMSYQDIAYSFHESISFADLENGDYHMTTYITLYDSNHANVAESDGPDFDFTLEKIGTRLGEFYEEPIIGRVGDSFTFYPNNSIHRIIKINGSSQTFDAAPYKIVSVVSNDPAICTVEKATDTGGNLLYRVRMKGPGKTNLICETTFDDSPLGVSFPIQVYGDKYQATYKINGTATTSSAMNWPVGKDWTLEWTVKKYIYNTATKSYEYSSTITDQCSYDFYCVGDNDDKFTVKRTGGKYTIRANQKASLDFFFIVNYKNTYITNKEVTVNMQVVGKPVIKSLTNTSSGITVKWGKISSASGYYIYRSTNGGTYNKIKTITSNATVSYADTTTKRNGSKYQYKVYAYKKFGNYTHKVASAVKTRYYLTRPTISSLTNSASKKMTVKWGKNSKATGYQIQYSTSSTFASGNKTVRITSPTTVSKTISYLTKGKTYYVRVRAYKTVNGTKHYSAYSTKKTLKITR